MNIKAFASETLTVANTPVGASASLLVNQPAVQKASFIVEGAPVRITVDNTVPSASVGMPFNPGDLVTIEGDEDIKAFKAVRTTATSASLYVTYFK